MTNKAKYFCSSVAAGSSLIIMALLAAFSYGYVFGGIVLLDDPVETLNNLLDAKGLFIFGIVGWMGIILADLIVTYALYVFLKEVRKIGALVGGIFRLLYTIFFECCCVEACPSFNAYR